MTRFAALLLCVGLTCSVFGQRDLKDVPDPDPAKQAAMFDVADGFEINLFASDPMLAKPINMNWDARGRLWIASSAIYPQIKPGQKPTDQIVVLEDTDHDGKADKSTVFAEGLLVPTTVLPDPTGGAYVGNSTELLHLTDTDGDGRADQSKVVFSGFGTEDTHHILHTLRWGPDGRIYFNQSIYIHSHIETPHGVRRLGGGGIWQFRPETWELDVYCRGFVNTWGHHFDAWGQRFATDGAFGEGINYVFPGAVFITAPGAKRILRGMNPGQPKECGLEVLSGRHLPEDWRGTMITNDFRGNRVVRFAVADDRGQYVSRQMPDVAWTKHIAFRPIDVKMGPDGAIYIADWYNPIIQHGEVDFRDPRRDHVHGRIWRITAKNRPLLKHPDLIQASTETLLDYLKTPEQWVRTHTKLQLKTRGAAVVLPELKKWLARLDPKHADFEQHRLEGLWVFQSLNTPDPALLGQVLASPDARARAAAVTVLREWLPRLPDASSLLEKAVADAHPRVRLEAVNTLRQLGGAAAFGIAMRVLNQPMDPNLDFALWLTARELETDWLSAHHRGELKLDPKPLIFALKAIENPAALGPLVSALLENTLGDADRQEVLELMAQQAGPNELGLLYDAAMNPRYTADQRVAWLGVLDHAARQRKIKPAGDAQRVVKLLEAEEASIRAAAARVAGRWRVPSAIDMLKSWASGAETPAAVRAAAFDGLSAMGGDDAKKTLLTLSDASQSVPVRVHAVVALLSLDPKSAAQPTLSLWQTAPAEADLGPVFDAIVRSKAAPGHLAAALKDQKIPTPVALAALQRMGSTRQDAQSLTDALRTAGGVQPMVQALSAEQMSKLVEQVKASGDPARGEAIYRRAGLACTACHAIAGIGSAVGPDLVSIGASAPTDYLIDSLLNPNAKIKEGYHTVTVVTKEGQVHVGTVLRENDHEIVLRESTNAETAIRKDNIQQRQMLPNSLMPPGLTAQLRQDEFVDLVAFLSQLGKPGPYQSRSDALVRRWRVLNGDTQQIAHQLRRSSSKFVTGDDPILTWQPLYSQVSGELPLEDLPGYKRFADELHSFVRCEIAVAAPGEILIRASEPTTLEAWIGGEPIDLVTGKLTLPAGRHEITFGINRRERSGPLRIEVAKPDGSPARVEPVSGR